MDILSQIVKYKKTVIASTKEILPITKMNLQTETRGFEQKIVQNVKNGKINIIAEIKKGSPSKGMIVENIDVEGIAKEYERGGASCISVLTDEKFFFGSNLNLQIAKESTTIPILRKDFIIDEYQIYESKHIGADAILLIASILTAEQIAEFEKIASSLSLSVLLEIHNEIELNMILENTKSALVGINNRNLRDFSVNVENTKNLIKKLPKERIPICESGVESKSTIDEMYKIGCNTFLIGTAIMQKENKAEFIKNLIQ